MLLHVWVAGIYATVYIFYYIIWVCFYDHATTNLAFHDAETSQDKLSKHITFAVYYCHPDVYQTASKHVHFTMLISLKQ